MKPTEIRDLLKVTILAKLPILIKGAPGVGKSDIVTQAAKACGADILILHPVVSDPTDFKGLPGIVKDRAEWLPYGELRRVLEAKKLLVVFLDDLGQAPAVVQAAAMQLILARKVNGLAVSEHVVFIAATNRREDRAGVTGILEPVKSRFAAIVELTPNVDEWCAWALDNDVPPVLVAFIRFRPQLLMDTNAPTNDIVNRPSPRTVTQAGKLFDAGIRHPEVIAGAAGPGFASEFLGFVQVFESLPSIDSILLDPMKARVPTEPAALFAVSVALANRATRLCGGRVVKYAMRLPEEFGVLCIRDAIRVCPAVQETTEFIKWAAAHQDALVN